MIIAKICQKFKVYKIYCSIFHTFAVLSSLAHYKIPVEHNLDVGPAETNSNSKLLLSDEFILHEVSNVIVV